ncbi:STAS domain-containing protein [Anabaena cylindrica FACHB-243]|uniref:Anti-sigma factor antagonist n=1 Tax=Anabaena cylindrica (strain ATCC 27899 / PCC 7122) TaxID=272123 RepID=K9ZAM6_ANACC|nr:MULTISPECIES: STAS domain-containing protein [Anabaena]AFZ56211.1 anti-sigma-factor antagonist [Anabaena cylindrica PCC 7122]MBD2417439.1 STAS domain-containing protein [Anabaena cylindrica FACHB-243]MBY5284626.1 STAS domain-containing protein [Anabaena sp. CCAP 1446/1C]MBY5311465.1 STAS domain-containing protein [Anabaena sp. CCAP 1446/1C]MCM2407608.1 STAS domain-containing protein [Anabaena sp. CCAP 1446/1C]
MSQQVKVLTLKKNLNAETSSEFQQDIAQILESGVKTVLVDCQNITFLDSSGLGSLVLAFKTLRDGGTKMVLCSINEQVRMIFELTSMNEIFEIFPSQDAFNQILLTKN